MVSHPIQSLFLGTFPMGFATIINMFCFVCVPTWGQWAAYFALAMWIVDAVISVLACFGIPFIIIVAEVVPNFQIALGTLVTSFVLWGVGVLLSLTVIVIYLMRLMLHKLPPKAVIVSMFLPLGPLGQGGYGIQKLGSVAKTILPQTNTLGAGAGDTFYEMGFVTGLLFWAFGLFWLLCAVGSIAQVRKFPFNLGWWAFTFPLGVYATCTCQLGREMPSKSFAMLGTIFSLSVIFLWILVTAFTISGIHDGTLFVAPCLAVLREKRRREFERERLVNIGDNSPSFKG
ncbi:conserved hypothetical protein [Talaromyces stipitatus ATCC 10500]|uniref:Voltage-dependent anion channel n=1 Tax=Talaromyces stipitatus (strain ATCC 10500 / CBS 375.48 / QM 6759 / NRRL 1006) TaxID=441959 RepID=B8M467_TALSN|nr:uncharacterized protein TSTA_040040 [Talaromyces stipitatus ATCC 10500]EED20810.1 conserved hypothetical protein [Talaromyces stipitatus ATCC 10500]